METHQFIDGFAKFIRDVVHTSVLEAHQNLPMPPTHDRIGGMNLAVEVTGMARQTIYNMASKGQIPHAKPNGRLVFSERDLRAWLLKNQRMAPDQPQEEKPFRYVIGPGRHRKRRS